MKLKSVRCKAKRVGKALKSFLTCTKGVSKEQDPPPVPTFTSQIVQTENPFVCDQLRHGGDTMQHRSTSLMESSGANQSTSSHAVSLRTGTTSGSVRVLQGQGPKKFKFKKFRFRSKKPSTAPGTGGLKPKKKQGKKKVHTKSAKSIKKQAKKGGRTLNDPATPKLVTPSKKGNPAKPPKPQDSSTKSSIPCSDVHQADAYRCKAGTIIAWETNSTPVQGRRQDEVKSCDDQSSSTTPVSSSSMQQGNKVAQAAATSQFTPLPSQGSTKSTHPSGNGNHADTSCGAHSDESRDSNVQQVLRRQTSVGDIGKVMPPTKETTSDISTRRIHSLPKKSHSIAAFLNCAGLAPSPISSSATNSSSVPSFITERAYATHLDCNSKKLVSKFSAVRDSKTSAGTQTDKEANSTSVVSSGNPLRKLSSTSAGTNSRGSSTETTQAGSKSKLYKLFHITRKSAMRKNPTSMPAVGPTTQEQGTQLSLDEIELAYLNSGIAGFPNIGNTCYMNSTIQCLSHTLEMTDIFLCSTDDAGLVSSVYKQVMQEMWFQSGLPNKTSNSSVISSPLQALSKKKSYVKSISLYTLKEVMAAKYPQFRGNEQNDAQEFLRHLVGDLHEELKSKNKSPRKDVFIAGMSAQDQGRFEWEQHQSVDGSPISDIFMGQFRSSLQCKACKNCSYQFETFWDIGLPIPKSKRSKEPVPLLTCLDQFTQDEVLDGNNRPYCQWCSKPQTFVKKMAVQRFPPVLTLYLSRFSEYNPRTKSIEKLYTAVNVPHIMDLTSYASPETVEDFGGNICYEMYGVVNHYGSIHSGHYAAFIKHYASGTWFAISDDEIMKFPTLLPNDVIASRNAYILFYRRVINSSTPGTGSASGAAKVPP